MEAREQRWLGIAGLVFVALLVVAVATSTNLTANASPARVVSYYHSHKGGLQVGAVFIGLAVFEGMFFFWYLRTRLSGHPATKGMENVAFAGAVLFATGGGLGAGLRLTIGDGIGHLDPTALQTLNALVNTLNIILSSAGIAVFLVGNGIAILRGRVLPRWLAWLGFVLAVLTLTGAGAPIVGLWILVASVVLVARAGTSAPVVSPVNAA